uniref:DUF4219 domain-containing protein n=1 Tax=Trichuris muris TaxID=70415 RepID=A0A5S6QXW0_TRIMR
MASENAVVDQPLIPLLDGGNYEVWKIKMRGLLMKEDLWNVTAQPKPETADLSWERANCTALGCITLALGNDPAVLIARCETAWEAWLTLQRQHERSSYGSRLFLRRKLYSFRYNGGPMQAHIIAMLKIVEQLRGAGVEISVGDQGRNEADLTLDYVCGRIQDEYIRRIENRKMTGARSNGGGSIALLE